MSDKYIIKNCPALYQIEGMTNECLDTDYQCEDCTDCLLKQIVELCKGCIRENEHDIYRAGRMSLAVNILGKLNIQEVK